MRILVTGGAGYVGSVLVPNLLALGHEVRVLDNLMYGGRGLLPCFAYPGFDFIKGNVLDDATLKQALRGRDAIIHLAAIVGYPACKRDPRLAQEVNLEARASWIACDPGTSRSSSPRPAATTARSWAASAPRTPRSTRSSSTA